ncbi:2',5'-phosphodiesterase 12-like [Oppia nitens]|uniref:2',5'-phosphodiesterase 12-like n=1 Tax=Oppia nitens TaxID=1686743 RepID=UPI0023DB8EC3|nr:2',5'-phosphodiesterase 12-like [Oppia nitens]
MAANNRCDVRCVDSDQTIDIAFTYSFDTSFKRNFHFKRDKNETLKQTFQRISLNVIKCMKNGNKKQKQTTRDKTETNDLTIELIADDITVSNDSFNRDVWKSGDILKVGDNIFDVYLNAPSVKSIRLAKVIMSSFKVYPIVSLEFCTLSDCKFEWLRQLTKKSENVTKKSCEEWETVGEEGFCYTVRSDDIGYKLKVVCSPTSGRQYEAISENTIDANPGLCPFQERHVFCQTDVSYNCFRILSYNILADIYADSDYSRTVLYPYCPPYALAIDYRKQLLLNEIIGYNADICCLQEVDKYVFNNDLKPILSSLKDKKFRSFFSEKGNTGEGLATFVNENRFEVINTEKVNISNELKTNPIFDNLLHNISANEKLFDRLMARKSIIQVILVRDLQVNDKTLLIGNTHLYFHPDSDHIRLIQSYIYVKYIENLIKVLSEKRPELNVSPILCGDYNSCPEFGVFQLMTNGFVGKDSQDFRSNSDETIDGLDLSHSLSFGSACDEPIYTNYTPFFSGCLDYIFYDKNNLMVSEIIPLPDHQQVSANTALPSIVFPSDHLAIICVLQWKPS